MGRGLWTFCARERGAKAWTDFRRSLTATVVLGGLVAGAAQAAETPSTRIGTAPLVSPSAVRAAYSSAPPSADPNAAVAARPREIVLLAKALGYDRAPEAFALEAYNYVHNNIRIAWTFGLQKGGLGAIVDRSGTAFDQAELLAEVLREGGVTATAYEFGTITLNKDQFAAWSGITRATAACQMLSSGGIPASINGTVNASCAYGSADVQTITLTHVWVKATINGATYYLDPAYKAHDITTGDATLASLVPAGGALAAATNGMASGVDNGASYVQSVKTADLGTALRGYARNVQCLIEGGVVDNVACSGGAAHAADALEDLIGGMEIRREYPIALATARPAYASPDATSWSGGIPDDFRTKFRVKVDRCPYPKACTLSDVDRITIFDRPLFVDDIYGRKLMIYARDQAGGKDELRLVDEFGGSIVLDDDVPANGALDIPGYNDAKITLMVDHPYPTASGAPSASGYMDQTIVKKVFMWMPVVIVNGWGDVGKGFVDKWGAREDNAAPWYAVSQTGCEDVGKGCNKYPSSSGDGRREQLAAGWLSQSSRAAQIHAAIADARYTHHHSIGVVSAETRVSTVYYGQTTQILGHTATDSFDRIDIDTAFSLTSKANDVVRRRAAVHAIAETMEILEGTVAAQVADLPDTASVATRFAWGSASVGNEDRPFEVGFPVGTRRFLNFNAPLTTGQTSLLKVDGLQPTDYSGNDGIHDHTTPEMNLSEAGDFQSDLYVALQDYANAGFGIVASEESFLGPGQKAGPFRKNGTEFVTWTHSRSYQRGGAFVATKYDGAGEPVEIAHVVVGDRFRSKGGGGGAQPGHQAQYDPKKAADILKTRFVDRSSAVGVDLLSGAVTYSSPAKLEIGQGEFPDKLSAEIFWRGGEFKQNLFAPPGHTEPQAPWSTNWHNMLAMSGSGMEAMGVTDIRATGATIAAFLAMQDVYRAAPSTEREVAAVLVGAWWANSMVHNVVTVNVGAGTQQFVRRFDKTWFAPGAGKYAQLFQTSEPSIHTKKCVGQAPNYVPTRGWNYSTVSFAVRGANGDIQNFPYWEKKIQDEAFCTDAHGFRMTSWVFPKGVTVNLTYSNIVGGGYDYLIGVSNNLGRSLTFSYNGAWISSISDGTRTITVSDDVDGRVVHTDADGKTTKFRWTVGNDRYQLTRIYGADEPDPSDQRGALEYVYDSMGRVETAMDRLAARGGRLPHVFLLSHGLRGERVDPEKGRYAVDYDDDKHPIRIVDELSRVVLADYDGRGRVKEYTYPEGDREQVGYDERNNTTIMIKIAKPGSPEYGSPIVVRAAWDATWNKPSSVFDARNNETRFTYYASGAGAGELWQVFRAPVSGGTPTYTFTYNAFGQPDTATDPTNLVAIMAYDPNHYLRTTTVDPNGINAITTFTNNAYGDPVDVDGPRTDVADVGHAQYDAMRRKVLEIGPDPGTGKPAAKRTTYDAVGRAWKTEQGYYSAGSFTPLITTTLELDPVGNKVKETTPAGVTQFSYDGLDRLICTARRMSAATHSNACQITPKGAFGDDQISWNTYDKAGQLLKTAIGVGAQGALNLGIPFVRYMYSANGQKTDVIDGVGNLTHLQYDGFDRLITQYFPLASARGQQKFDANDFEAYRYDPNGNRVFLQKRDKQTFTFQFDTNDRIIRKIVDSKPAENVGYTYDLAGRITSSLFESPVEGISYGYDTARRLTSETSYGRTVGFTLDKAGNRAAVTWPGGAAVEYVYDAANQLTKVREPGAQAGNLGLLADFHYDDLGRRADMIRGNGGRADYTYDPAGRLLSLGQTGKPAAATPQPLLQTISYTPASQIASLTRANLNYVHTGRPPYANETFDGQNRISRFTAINGYDPNGNLTSDGVRTFKYDSENRLTKVTGGQTNMDLAYDPAGRLRSTTAGGATTYFLYVGDKLVAEYSAATGTTTVRRYVHTNGVDEPIMQYDDITGGQRLWLHPDRQGSIVALSDEAGNVTATNLYTYGPWGEPSGWTGRRFGYTGQAILPEAQLYHYKARVYDPILGRFLQTDPIGQGDDPNLYVYVGADPTNKMDPTGECRQGAVATGAYNVGRTTVIVCSDGFNEWRSGGSLAWRNNNPGNLIATDTWKPAGAVGYYDRPDNKYHLAVFPDRNSGEQALVRLLYTQRYQTLTVGAAIAKYAPPTENNTTKYASMVAESVGVDAKTAVSSLNPAQIGRMVSTIERVEGWKAGSITYKQNTDGSITFKKSDVVTGSRVPVTQRETIKPEVPK